MACFFKLDPPPPPAAPTPDGLGFPTVVALVRHARRVLAGPGATSLLDRLLPHHPTRGRRPVKAWGVTTTPRGALCVTADGALFSWRDCCRGAVLGPVRARGQRFRRMVIDAFRGAIRPQVEAFRAAQPDAAGFDVDHDPAGGRFVDLMDGFLAGRQVRSCDLGSGPRGPCLVDPTFAAAWQAYHRDRARLRFLTPAANQRANAGFKKCRRC